MAEKIEEIIVPIVAASTATKGLPLRLLGTAFFVGSARTFLTAWHVIEDVIKAREAREEIFLIQEAGQQRILNIVEVHRPNVQADIAIGLLDRDVLSPFYLLEERLGFGKNVCCIGYPGHIFQNSPDLASYSAPLRFMKGYMMHDVWTTDALHSRYPVDYYELSFTIPRGISGAPVYLEGTHTVIGICCGTTKGEQLDYIEEREPGKVTKVYQVEQVGIAQMSSIVANATAPWLAGRMLKSLRI